jgi:hypothetical protein
MCHVAVTGNLLYNSCFKLLLLEIHPRVVQQSLLRK